MQVVALLLALPTAGVLVWAGLEKLRMRGEFAGTLAGLGWTGPRGRALGVAVPAAELATSGALLLAPSSVWPRLGIAGLGAVFAAAGLMALRSGRHVACSCLGAGGGELGGRQLALLPLWLGVAAALHLLAPDWSFADGVRWLAGATVAVCVVRAAAVVKAMSAAAAYRKATDQSARVRKPIVAPRTEELEMS